jgi:hypothetical protein
MRSQLLASIAYLERLGIPFGAEDSDVLRRYSTGGGVAVVGLVNRGKSTLVNSLINKKILPTGAEPESWCPVHIRSATPTSHFKTATGETQWLSTDPIDLEQSLSRKSATRIPLDAISVHINFSGRLPLELKLIDTPGLIEEGNESVDLLWRSSGARAAVLVTSYPPGISSEDLVTIEKLKAYFGEHVLVVLKGVDSSVSYSDLESASSVWLANGVTPLLVVDSRVPSDAPWGSGLYSELEQAISKLNELAEKNLERLASTVQRVVLSASQSWFAISTHLLKGHLQVLRESFDLDLLPEIKEKAKAAYLQLLEKHTQFSQLGFLDLLDVAHCGSLSAQHQLTRIWKDHALKEKALVGMTFIEALQQLAKKPHYSRYDPYQAVECSISDLESMSFLGAEFHNLVQTIHSPVSRCIKRSNTATELNRLLELRLVVQFGTDLAEKIFDEVILSLKQPTQGWSLQNLNLTGFVTPSLGPSAASEINRRTGLLIQQCNVICSEIYGQQLTVNYGATPTLRASFWDNRIDLQIQRMNSVLSLLGEIHLLLDDKIVDQLMRLEEQIDGPRGLKAWLSSVRDWSNEYTRIRRNNYVRAEAIGAIGCVVAVFAISQTLVVAAVIAGLGGAFSFYEAQRRKNEPHPTEILSFIKFSKSADDFVPKHKRYERVDFWVLTIITLCLTVNALLVRAIDVFSSDERPKVFQEVGSPASTTPPNISRVETTTDTSLETTTSSSSFVLKPVDAGEIFEYQCGEARFNFVPSSNQIVSDFESTQLQLIDNWKLGDLWIFVTRCEGSAAVHTLRVVEGSIRSTAELVDEVDFFKRFDFNTALFGAHGRTCCFPNVPLARAEVFLFTANGSMQRSMDNVARYPIWNVARQDCDSLVSEQAFLPQGNFIASEVQAYATMCVEGPLVSSVQEILVDNGYELEVDGQFGPITLSALRDFAQSRGVNEVDGVALVAGELFFAVTSVKNN